MANELEMPTLDMRHPAFRDDPHPLVRRLREAGRITRDVVGIWVMCHHADISAALRGSALSRDVKQLSLYQQQRPYLADSALERAVEAWMLLNDPPKHTRLRRLAQAAFRPGVIAALRERVVAITDELLDGCERAGRFDLMSALAQPLPVRVICDVLGLPPEDFAQTKAWSDALALVLEPVTRREQRAKANAAAEEMVAYLSDHVERHRAHRRDDLLGTLVAAQDDGGALSSEELLGNLMLLFIAGHETTTNLLGNGALTLLRHPQELQRLRAQPELMGTAIEEMLRFEPSVNITARHTVAPYAVGDVVVPPDQIVYVMLGAGNRDPAVFAEPDRFDIARHPNPHLTFGAGIHYCLGAPLARLEGEVAFARLLQRFPTLSLVDGTPRWRPLINLRGLEALHLQAG